MPHHRTRYSAEFKAKVALAALSESKTLPAKVHPTQTSKWKQDLSKAPIGKGKKKEVNHEAVVAELHRKVIQKVSIISVPLKWFFFPRK